MKTLALILSLLLSWIFGGGAAPARQDAGAASERSQILQEASAERSPDCSDFNTLCLTSARGVGFSAGESTFAPPVRTVTSARKVQPSARTPFRLVKGGKEINRRTFQTFLLELCSRPSGRFCAERYIFSIRHLLI